MFTYVFSAAAAAAIAAAAIAAVVPAAVPAAAAQDEDEYNDPQAATAAKTAIAAPHNEYLLKHEVLRRLWAALNLILCGPGKRVRIKNGPGSAQAVEGSIHFRKRLLKFIRIPATSARLAVSLGRRVPSAEGVISPLATAQATDSLAQSAT